MCIVEGQDSGIRTFVVHHKAIPDNVEFKRFMFIIIREYFSCRSKFSCTSSRQRLDAVTKFTSETSNYIFIKKKVHLTQSTPRELITQTRYYRAVISYHCACLIDFFDFRETRVNISFRYR